MIAKSNLAKSEFQIHCIERIDENINERMDAMHMYIKWIVAIERAIH